MSDEMEMRRHRCCFAGHRPEKLTEDEKNLCEMLVRDCKSSDILLATDPSLGRQVRINYATFNLEKSLVTI